jgi:hypothetical protein
VKAPDRDHFDDWLDKALRQYGNAEPRIGLENRIFANMALRGKHARFRYSYAWVLAGATAGAFLIGLWLGIWHRPLGAPQKVTGQQTAGNVATQAGPKIIPAARREKRVAQLPSRKKGHGVGAVELAGAPRLEQFPSPRPLSQQEVLLARYARQFPTEAVLIAQRQDKFQQEIEQAEQEMKNISRSSERQER